MTGGLIRKGTERHTGRERWPYDYGGGDWRDVAANQGMLAAGRQGRNLSHRF